MSSYLEPAFDSVPLAERIHNVGHLYETITMQRALTRQAVSNDDGPLPPEIRIGTISAFRVVEIEFTKEMKQLPSLE